MRPVGSLCPGGRGKPREGGPGSATGAEQPGLTCGGLSGTMGVSSQTAFRARDLTTTITPISP